jgi:hypothetical protein
MNQNLVRKVKPSEDCVRWIRKHLPRGTPIECEIAENAWTAGAETAQAEIRRLQVEVDRLNTEAFRQWAGRNPHLADESVEGAR